MREDKIEMHRRENGAKLKRKRNGKNGKRSEEEESAFLSPVFCIIDLSAL